MHIFIASLNCSLLRYFLFLIVGTLNVSAWSFFCCCIYISITILAIFLLGLGKDISDEDDSESKPITQAFPNLSQGKHFDFVDRPSTSPAISHLPLQMRPQTAPESTSLNSQASALPWMSRESLKENMSIQEVWDFVCCCPSILKSIVTSRLQHVTWLGCMKFGFTVFISMPWNYDRP